MHAFRPLLDKPLTPLLLFSPPSLLPSLQYIFLALFVGLVYLRLSDSVATGVPDRLSSLWFVLAVLRCAGGPGPPARPCHATRSIPLALHGAPMHLLHSLRCPAISPCLPPPPLSAFFGAPRPSLPPPRSFTPSYTAAVAWDSERLLLRRETGQGMYSPSAWFAAKTLTVVPVQVVQTTLFCVIT